MTTHYDNKKRAFIMLRQNLAASPQTIEDMHRKVALEFGFGRKFVLEFLELHEGAIVQVGDAYEWKA